MVTPGVVLVALVVASPALLGALDGRLPLQQALGVFLVAVVFVTLGRGVLRAVTGVPAGRRPPGGDDRPGPVPSGAPDSAKPAPEADRGR
jgi:hypothetical protein